MKSTSVGARRTASHNGVISRPVMLHKPTLTAAAAVKCESAHVRKYEKMTACNNAEHVDNIMRVDRELELCEFLKCFFSKIVKNFVI